MPRRFIILFTFISLALPAMVAHLQATPVVISKPDHQITSSPLDAVAISTDGTLIVSGGRDNVVRLW
ncbi:MAG: hypothetical protein H0X30_34460, partial [Anaerolineae bacterium]|nr:hypothetical protein [Anaerolineae bacterium]